MANITEHVISRTETAGKRDPVAELMFDITDAIDENDVHNTVFNAQLSGQIPATYSGLPFTNYQMATVGNGLWTVAVRNATIPITFKVLVNDLSWCNGDDFVAQPGQSMTIEPTTQVTIRHRRLNGRPVGNRNRSSRMELRTRAGVSSESSSTTEAPGSDPGAVNAARTTYSVPAVPKFKKKATEKQTQPMTFEGVRFTMAVPTTA